MAPFRPAKVKRNRETNPCLVKDHPPDLAARAARSGGWSLTKQGLVSRFLLTFAGRNGAISAKERAKFGALPQRSLCHGFRQHLALVDRHRGDRRPVRRTRQAI